MKLSYLILYILALSLVSFFLMGIDKWKAKRNRWRVPEKVLLLTALFGGAAGATVGMHLFHHKTRHWYFRYGLPVMLFFHALLLAAFLYWDAFIRT